MFKILKTTIVSTLLLASFATASIAAPATFKCPACGMAMAHQKGGMMTVPVYVKSAKSVYYCCPDCKAGKAASAYFAKHKKPMPV
jgi:rubredoxin